MKEIPTIKEGSRIKFKKIIIGMLECEGKGEGEVLELSDFEVKVRVQPNSIIGYVDYNDITEVKN